MKGYAFSKKHDAELEKLLERRCDARHRAAEIDDQIVRAQSRLLAEFLIGHTVEVVSVETVDTSYRPDTDDPRDLVLRVGFGVGAETWITLRLADDHPLVLARREA